MVCSRKKYPEFSTDISELKNIINKDFNNQRAFTSPDTKKVVENLFDIVEDPNAARLLKAILHRRISLNGQKTPESVSTEGLNMIIQMKIPSLDDKQFKAITRKDVVSSVLGKNLKLNFTSPQPQIKK